MGLFARAARSPFLLRRVLVELRGIRRALERQADALELHGQAQAQTAGAGQAFRSYARSKADLSDPEVKALTEVSYVDDRMLGVMLQKEEELRALLGRDPSEYELARAYQGEVE